MTMLFKIKKDGNVYRVIKGFKVGFMETITFKKSIAEAMRFIEAYAEHNNYNYKIID